MNRRIHEATFEEHIVPLYTEIYHYICRLTDDRELASDLTQETMIKAWNGVENLNSLDAVRPWVFRIATNEVNLYFRTQRAQKRDHLVDEDGVLIIENLPSMGLEPLEVIIAKSDKDAAIEALNRVEYLYRMIIILHLIEGLSFTEISQMLHKANSTVRYQYKKGIKLLRKNFYHITKEI
ncbi:MAG: RNA polymerase sigma factor [Firmicutes bacterium]|jgi:RNA polymerase sigma-70 factor (ECF subfamily)|nr:RNA polymerase sigma factor [Bacillota bacterium]